MPALISCCLRYEERLDNQRRRQKSQSCREQGNQEGKWNSADVGAIDVGTRVDHSRSFRCCITAIESGVAVGRVYQSVICTPAGTVFKRPRFRISRTNARAQRLGWTWSWSRWRSCWAGRRHRCPRSADSAHKARVPLELSPKARHTWRGRRQSTQFPPEPQRHCKTTSALREVRFSSSGAARPFRARARRVPSISSRACLTTQSSRRRVETSRFLPARRCNSSFAPTELNRSVQFLLARLRRAFLQDSPTPGGSLRFAHRGLISFTPPACKPAARTAKRYSGSSRPSTQTHAESV